MTIISADIAVMAVSRFQGLCIRISVILFFVFNSARDRIGDEQEVGKHQDSCEQGQYENMSREEAIQGSLPD